MDYWRGNNFALIRVLASAQVAVVHALYWFGIEQQIRPLGRVLQYFPGVPIFFFISGLLVTRACLHTTTRDYLRNRGLRIFPALWVALLLTLLPVFLFAECSVPSTTVNWLSWWTAQMSFAQMWTPAFLDDCWRASFNGGRWTIAVELEFYALLPLLLLLRGSMTRVLLLGGLLAVASIGTQAWILAWFAPDAPQWLQILHISLVPYFWIFFLGMLAYAYFDRIAPWFAGKGLWWLAAYAATILLGRQLGWRATTSDINPLSMVVLSGLVMSVALSLRGFSDRLLRGHDFTYGLYLLHPVVFLLMARAGLGNGMANAAFALLISCGFAAASWFLIERPFMRGKRHSSHPIPKMAKMGTSAIS